MTDTKLEPGKYGIKSCSVNFTAPVALWLSAHNCFANAIALKFEKILEALLGPPPTFAGMHIKANITTKEITPRMATGRLIVVLIFRPSFSFASGIATLWFHGINAKSVPAACPSRKYG
jgi:hypothetical protein